MAKSPVQGHTGGTGADCSHADGFSSSSPLTAFDNVFQGKHNFKHDELSYF